MALLLTFILSVQEFEYITDCHSERSEESLATYAQSPESHGLPEPDNPVLARSDHRAVGCPRKGLHIRILKARIVDGSCQGIPHLHGSLVAACREVLPIVRPVQAQPLLLHSSKSWRRIGDGMLSRWHLPCFYQSARACEGKADAIGRPDNRRASAVRKISREKDMLCSNIPDLQRRHLFRIIDAIGGNELSIGRPIGATGGNGTIRGKLSKTCSRRQPGKSAR